MATFQTKQDKRNGGIKAYAVTSTMNNGKRVRVWTYLGTFPTTRDAEREFNRVSANLNRERVHQIHANKELQKTTPTLVDTVEKYLSSVDGIKLNSSQGLKPYRIALSHTCRYLGGLKLHELTPDKITGYIGARRKEITYRKTLVSPKTIINELTQLSSLCGWAAEAGLIKEHPFKTGQRPLRSYFPKVEKKPKRYLKPEEQRALLRATNDSPYAQVVVHLLLCLGIRRGELSQLRLEEVDIERRQITVRAEKTNDFRILPMPAALIPILKKLKTHRPTFKNWYPRETKHQIYLLCDEMGNPVGEPGKQLFKGLVVKAGIIGKLRPHDLRHTFVSNMRAAGLSSYEIMKLTGHRNVSTLEGYGVNAPKDLLAKMERGTPVVTPRVDEKVDNHFIWLKTPMKQGLKLAGAVGFEPTNARSKIW